jgi:UDP-N-acetylmuramyl tripeptide synthase
MLSGKFLISFMRAIGKNGTHFPGTIALAICPDLLYRLRRPATVIAVTGTNGKTTVSNMILQGLTDFEYDVTNNKFGGNIDKGITTALIDGSALSGKPKRTVAVLEVDERSAGRIFPALKPDFIVCTNLSRDSFKRNAHTEFIASILTQHIPENSKLILNGDCLIASHIAPNSENRVYFGVGWGNGEATVTDNIIKDIVYCPECDSKLDYEFVRYNHIGRAVCTKCDYGSPELDTRVVDRSDGYVTMQTKDGFEKYKLVGKNITDLYNMTAAITFLRTFGIPYDEVQKSFEKQKIVETRFKYEKVGEKEIFVTLAKGQNPVACSRGCDFVRRAEGESKCVIIILDDVFDAKDSSENTAWLHEIDFEFLNQPEIKQVVVGGKRCADFMVRFLLAGIPKEKITACDSEAETVDLIDTSIEKFFVLYDLFNTANLKLVTDGLKERLLNPSSQNSTDDDDNLDDNNDLTDTDDTDEDLY